MESIEKTFLFDQGVDNFNPDFTPRNPVVFSPDYSSRNFRFANLLNAQPRRNRLQTPNRILPFQALGGLILDFDYTYDPSNLSGEIYVFNDTEAYIFSLVTGQFGAFGTPFTYSALGDPFATVLWNGVLYVSRLNVPLTIINAGVATTADTRWSFTGTPPTQTPTGINVSGKYACVNFGHLFLANVLDTASTPYPCRIRWSDLNNPGNPSLGSGPGDGGTWQVWSGTEADSYDIDGSNQMITGISSQRGNLLIYTPYAIFLGVYVGGSELYSFQQIYSNVGNIYHYAHIQVNDIDYFIGRDNFYSLNGTQLTPIGDPIWQTFLANTLTLPIGNYVRAFVEPANREIFWVVWPPNASTSLEYVYNYYENKWSTRYSQNKTAFWFPTSSVSAFKPIGAYTNNSTDQFDQTFATTTEIGFNSSINLVQPIGFVGNASGEIYNKTNPFNNESKGFFDGTSFNGLIESFEFSSDSFFGMKELTGIKLLFSRVGVPTIQLYIGTRSSQAGPITWSSAIQISDMNNFANSGEFYFRDLKIAAKFIRLRFTWQNTDTNFVDEMYGVSLITKGDASKAINANITR